MFTPNYADEHSRVHLNDPEGDGYINANWVPLPRGRAIITQAPLEQTQQHF
jgi:protein tyrosine phosphatase